MEKFIARCVNSQDPQKLVDVLEKMGYNGLDVPLEELATVKSVLKKDNSQPNIS